MLSEKKAKQTDLIVKLVIFSVSRDSLQIFYPAEKLPTGKVWERENLDNIAKRVFKQKLNVPLASCYFEQLYTYSVLQNQALTVSIVYYVLLPFYLIPAKSRENLINVEKVEKKAKDKQAIQYAVQRLRWKVEYTNVVYSLLPREFTFSQLQTVYEAVLGRSLDKRNFRKKILSLNILIPTGEKIQKGRARPAQLYSFSERELKYVEIL